MGDKKSILVVDDEEGLRRLFSKIMEKEGYEVDVAANGWDAVTMAKYRRYSLIVMDLRMPRMTGEEAIERIERMYPQMKFLVISGYPLGSELKLRVDRGEIAYFSKPFDNDEVLRKVAELCSESR